MSNAAADISTAPGNPAVQEGDLRSMRLGIVSDAHHFLDEQGRPQTITPLVRQFEQWAHLFKTVVVLAPLVSGTPGSGCSTYEGGNISLKPIEPAGGNTLSAKVHLLKLLPKWRKSIKQLLSEVDAVQVRCPNNVGIPALLALARTNHLRQAVYTGTWMGYRIEPMTYRWQRWYLTNRFDGPVAVYGDWPDQPDHIVPSFSPSMSQAEWEAEEESVNEKKKRLRGLTEMPRPLRLATIGSLTKNQGFVLKVVAGLASRGIEAELDVLGGGSKQSHLEDLARQLKIDDAVSFHGQVPHYTVRNVLREVDFVIQAPSIEGYGKVPLEALTHGAVPVLSDVTLSSIHVGNGRHGRTFPPGDVHAAVEMVASLSTNAEAVISMIIEGRKYTRMLTLERWREHIHRMLQAHWPIGEYERMVIT